MPSFPSGSSVEILRRGWENSKSETRNPKQIPMIGKSETEIGGIPASQFYNSILSKLFRISDFGFRISDFGFRISNFEFRPAPWGCRRSVPRPLRSPDRHDRLDHSRLRLQPGRKNLNHLLESGVV